MTDTSRVWRFAALMFLIVVGVRVYVALAGPAAIDTLAVDDALITYRYAENIAAGFGFVYNSGEHVLGTTTPLYTILLALFAIVGLSIPLVSLIMGLLASGLTGLTLYFFSLRLKLGAFSIAPPLLYAVWPNAILSDISGLEVPLFTLGAILFFYLVMIGRYRLSALSAGLLALVRPEGLLLIALLFIFKYMIKRRKLRDVIVEAAIIFAIVTPWLIFAWIFFGSPIPNSIGAKLALYSGFSGGSFLERLYRLLSLHSVFGWIALIGWMWGLAYLLMRRFWGWLESLYMAITITALAVSDVNLFFWYKAPLGPLFALFIGAGIAGALRLALNLSGYPRIVWLSAALIILTALPFLGARVERTRLFTKAQSEIYLNQHKRAGEYLNEHARGGDIVVAEDIGYLGYTYRGRIIDRDGLVSPEAIAMGRAVYRSIVPVSTTTRSSPVLKSRLMILVSLPSSRTKASIQSSSR
ncbi:MAG: hypothetical protein IH914_06085 [candidate division Zixibacteria bacterium]|nr:hypothetical protein [candidate division Zixibacteria bacterium]